MDSTVRFLLSLKSLGRCFELTFKPIKPVYIIDLFGRIILAVLFFLNSISAWTFVILNICSFVLLAFLREYVHRKYKKKSNKILPSDLTEGFVDTEINYLGFERIQALYGLLGLIVSYWFFGRVLNTHHWYSYIFIFMLGTLALKFFSNVPSATLFPRSFDPVDYKVIWNVRHYNGNSKTEDLSYEFKDFLKEAERKFNPNVISVEEIDINDSEIARIESNLKNINTKVESYMLESVLIGALTFSGFLAVVLSDRVIYSSSYLFDMWTQIKDLFFSGNMTTLSEKLAVFSTTENLRFLVMLESLFCSVFFILILGLRMRFSSLSLKLDYLLRIMTIFNAKEEELITIELTNPNIAGDVQRRREKISFKISQAIKDANTLLKNIYPVARLMGWYRDIGLVLFFIILITSGLFLSPNVSFAILLVAILTWVFRLTETNLKVIKINRLLKRH